MRDDDCVIRNYRPGDFDSLVRLKNSAAELAPDMGYLSAEAVRDSLGRPGHAPERDLFIVERDGVVVGYMDLVPEARIGRAVIDCLIDPEHRRCGLSRRLFQRAAPRARALGAKVVQVNVSEGNLPARLVLKRAGFEVVRRSLELEAGLARLPKPGETTLPISCLEPDEADRLADIQNTSFTGAWGFSPNTTEEIRHALGTGDAVEGVCLARDGERPAGYCWSGTQENGKGESWGRIGMVGVDPEYRGRGLGRELLLAGLAYLSSKGLKVARLTVDSENAVACALYYSVGFTLRETSLWYEKPLD